MFVCCLSDECEENPTGCLYGGQCVDGVNKYTCTCPSGFTGEHCQEEKIFCANSACANGICLNDYDVNKAICICEDPYQTGTLIKNAKMCIYLYTINIMLDKFQKNTCLWFFSLIV